MLDLMFMCWLAFAVVFIVLLWASDAGNGGYLNASPTRRKEIDEYVLSLYSMFELIDY